MPLIRLPGFFPQHISNEEPVTFSDLFQSVYQLNELAEAAARGQKDGPFAACQPRHRHVARPRLFNPRFDVRETETAYELHGELPGINKENVHIEFTEPQTLTIHGRLERTYTTGTPPTGPVNDNTEKQATAVEASDEVASTASPTPASSVASHRATVSDEETETAKEKGEEAFTIISAENDNEVQAAKTNETTKPKPAERFWRQERSIGEFRRQFVFEDRVDEAAVSASLDNGILLITVPKAPKREIRRIVID